MLSLLKVIILLFTILYLPGYPMAKLIASSRSLALGSAPLLTIFVFLILGVILGTVGITGISATYLMLLTPFILGAIALWRCVKSKQIEPVRHKQVQVIVQICVYVCISLAVTYFVFLRGLGDVSNAIQESDNSAHLGSIIETAEDGNYSILKSATYPLESIANGSAPSLSYGFYPNALHVIASFGLSILNVNAPLAENAVITLFAGIIYPISSWVLLSFLFPNDKKTIYAGAIAVPAFSAFPFALCTFGPLYPNLCSLCCMPLLCASFISIISSLKSDRQALRERLLLFVLVSAAVCAIQPSTIFSAYIFLAPFCVHSLSDYMRNTLKSKRPVVIASCIGLSFVFVAIWTALFSSPAFSGVTTFHWPSLLSWKDGISNITTLSLRLMKSQTFLAVLLVIGLVSVASRREVRWLIASFTLMAAITYVGMVSDGFAQSYLTGFWYTDQWRTSACVAIIGVPLASIGMASVLDFISHVSRITQQYSGAEGSHINASVLASYLIMALCLFSPVKILAWPAEESALQYVKAQIHLNAAPSQSVPYSDEDKAFVEKANKLIPQGSLVLNVPDDGSSYAFLSGDINTYYRSNRIPDETFTSKLLRLHFSDIDNDSDVKEAVRENGISYVMLLDMSGYPQDSNEDSLWSLAGTHEKSMWSGLTSDALSEVKSLNLVLTDGTRYLYKINLDN